VESFKFLGIRYYPATYPSDMWEVFVALPFVILLDVILGLPIFTICLMLATPTHKEEAFQADTRNGASLSFTKRESFLSWLAVARQLLIDSNYFDKGTSMMSLTEWLEDNWKK